MTVLSNAVAHAQTSKVASQGWSHLFPTLVYANDIGLPACDSGSETAEVVCLADKQ